MKRSLTNSPPCHHNKQHSKNSIMDTTFTSIQGWKLRDVIKVVHFLFYFALHDIRIACRSIMGFFEKTKASVSKKISGFSQFFRDENQSRSFSFLVVVEKMHFFFHRKRMCSWGFHFSYE